MYTDPLYFVRKNKNKIIGFYIVIVMPKQITKILSGEYLPCVKLTAYFFPNHYINDVRCKKYFYFCNVFFFPS